MLNTTDLLDPEISTPSPASETVPLQPTRTDSTARVVCDLDDGNAFVETPRKPHIPVMSAFGVGQLHMCRLFGSWDLDKAVAAHGNALFRSIRNIKSRGKANSTEKWDDLTFRFGPKSFVYIEKERIVAFATTSGEAENLAKSFGQHFHKATAHSSGEYHLIQLENSEIKCHSVPLPDDYVQTDETLELHYGKGSKIWHPSVMDKLRNKDRGLFIFEGVPGTGKTFYIRHLIGMLRESHRFYFIPTSSLNILSRADFVGFWAEQRQLFADQQLVIILEDSDTALMTRGSDNREQVSAILNLTDGLLSDFLRLQIISTINCAASDIDSALLRPGRLLSYQVFEQLEYNDALRLAERLGKKLPLANTYSLAEVFAGNEKHEAKRSLIGFAA